MMVGSFYDQRAEAIGAAGASASGNNGSSAPTPR
jgi:hypothetical protein